MLDNVKEKFAKKGTKKKNAERKKSASGAKPSKKKTQTAKAKTGTSSPSKSSSGRKKRMTFEDYLRRKRRRNILIIVAVVLLFLTPVAGGALYAMHVVKEGAVPINPDKIYEDLSQKSSVYDDKGKEIDSLYFSDGDRILVEYDQLPKNLINAFVAIEDKTFFEHHGFNVIRMIGAIKEHFTGGGQIQGTSTITQQLARNVYLSDIKSERSINRKILEAHYALILEKELGKEKIMEAYLNTVYFGYGSYGVETASKNYFGKSVSELDLLECAALAALPQAPDSYALIKTDDSGVESELPVIKKSNGVKYLYGGEASANRRAQVLDEMVTDGYITAGEKQEALSEDLQEHVKVHTSYAQHHDTYFIDYCVEQVEKDLAGELGIGREEARTMIYSKGLKIYTCMNRKIQKRLSKQINDNDNYTSISYLPKDEKGNIVNAKTGKTLLHPLSYYLNEKGDLVLSEDDYSWGKDGSLVLKKGKKLLLYEVEAEDGTKYVQPELKSVYDDSEKGLYFYEGGSVIINPGSTSFDKKENCVVSKAFLDENDSFCKESDGKLIIGKNFIQMKQKVRQPQAAACIIDNDTGYLKAMVGGRGATGKYLYNRAVAPHQPGSSIKPLAVYAPALQMSVDNVDSIEENPLDLSSSDGSYWGKYITAGSIINDAPMKYNGKDWPKNAGGGFLGKISLRKAVQQSVNVCAVKVYQQMDVGYITKKLKRNGITSLDEEGDSSDLTPAALALGGMTNGVSPLEMTAAYATFPNRGIYREPLLYTKVLDSSGNLILENSQKKKRVFDASVAYIMTDILKSAVEYGTGQSARIYTQPVAGKTGTTSNQYDIWFCGFTPQYTMALWEGNDIHIRLTDMSSAAASFWANIMRSVCQDEAEGAFPGKPDDVVQINGEYYAEGTEVSAAGYRRATAAPEKKKMKSTRATTKSGKKSGGSGGSSGGSYTNPTVLDKYR